jgi:type IV fimbrial biogenesis protein FimT
MRRAAAGFTLLELMLVISIMGVLVTLAIPGFGYLSANTKVKSASTELYLAMIRARSEAVKRNRAVSISADAAGWQAGWQIVVDGNNDGDYVDTPDDDRIVSQQGTLKGVTVTEAGGATSVVYRPTGRLPSGAIVPQFQILSENPDHADLQRALTVDLTGRPYVETP